MYLQINSNEFVFHFISFHPETTSGGCARRGARARLICHICHVGLCREGSCVFVSIACVRVCCARASRMSCAYVCGVSACLVCDSLDCVACPFRHVVSRV